MQPNTSSAFYAGPTWPKSRSNTWPLSACALFPFLYGATNLLRGWFAGAHLPARLGRSTIYKVLLLCVCWPVFTLVSWPFSGVAIAIFLMLAAEFCEAWYLRTHRNRLTGEGLVTIGPMDVQ